MQYKCTMEGDRVGLCSSIQKDEIGRTRDYLDRVDEWGVVRKGLRKIE